MRDVADWSVRAADAKLTGNFNAKGPTYPLTVGTMRDRLACTAAVTRAISAGLTFRPLATMVADMLAARETLRETRQMNLKAGLTRERDPRCLRGWTSPNPASLQALRRCVVAIAAIAVVAFDSRGIARVSRFDVARLRIAAITFYLTTTG